MTYKILIVDDNPLIRMGLISMIQWEQFNAQLCAEAENGSQALSIIEKEQPDLVITDIRMPEKDGLFLLKEIQERYSQISTIVVSAYDEFDYAKQAICSGSLNYILKPINPKELNDTVRKALTESEKRKSEMLTKQTWGLYDRLKEEILQKSMGSNVNIVTIVFSFKCEIGSEPEISDITELIDHIDLDYIVMRKDKIYVLIIYSNNIISVQRIEELCNPFIKNIKTFIDKKSLFGISLPCKLDQFENSYNNAIYASANTIFYECDYLIYEKMPQNESLSISLEVYEKEIKLYIVSGNYSKVGDIINQIRNSIKVRTNANHNSLLTVSIDLLKILLAVDKKYIDKIRIIMMRLENHYQKIEFFSVEEINSAVDTIVQEIADDYIRNIRDKSDLIYRIKNMIALNYSSDISLSSISELFYVNASYLSRLFKEETGCNLNKYITHVRIEVAKNLLKNTDEKICNIAERVGYSDSDYFIKVFKKSTGLSPNAYKKM